MAGLLDYGIGAYNGSRILREDSLKDAANAREQQKLEELLRSNRADEDFKLKSLDETSALRRQQQESLDQYRQDSLAARNASQVSNILNVRPIGSKVTPEEYAFETKSGAPSALYDVQEQAGHLTGGEQGPTLTQDITFKGTQPQIFNVQRIQDAEERARISDENADLTRALAATREQRINEWGPPTVIIADPNNPAVSVQSNRGAVNKQISEGHPPLAPVPSPTQQQATANDVSSEQLGRLKQMYDKGGKNLIGPASGRLRSISQQIPGVPVDDTFANFQAESAAFRNSVIKAITGAQMSEREADRIRQQIPDVTDKPEVWEAKYAQTLKNLQDLNTILKRRAWQGGATTPPPPGGGGGGRRSGRFEVIEEP